MKSPISVLTMTVILALTPFASYNQNQSTTFQVTQGKFVYRDGSIYYGDLTNGLPEGTGSVQYSNGDRYEGEWKGHRPHGTGVYYYAGGTRKAKALWNNGKLIRVLSQTPGIPTAVSQKSDVKIWALVVGISTYHSMPSLDFADDDAYQVYAFLKSPAGGALPDEQIHVLIDESAARKNILDAIHEICSKIGENDVFFFYYSGHGLQDAFLPADFNGFTNKVYHREIIKLLNNTKAKHKIIIADACHSGGMLAAKSGKTTGLNRFYSEFQHAAGGIALFSSSKCEEYSMEDKRLRSGIFSYYLLKGINGKADANRDRIVTIAELYSYVAHNVKEYTQYTQNPMLQGNYDSQMPVATVNL